MEFSFGTNRPLLYFFNMIQCSLKDISGRYTTSRCLHKYMISDKDVKYELQNWAPSSWFLMNYCVQEWYPTMKFFSCLWLFCCYPSLCVLVKRRCHTIWKAHMRYSKDLECLHTILNIKGCMWSSASWKS